MGHGRTAVKNRFVALIEKWMYESVEVVGDVTRQPEAHRPLVSVQIMCWSIVSE